jgi:ABC-type polysaccharide/polyol phosphate transport system ATPase subunit
MQARLMLSLVSSQPTDILILDEVLDGADYFFQQKLSVRMKNFIKSTGATIFVSHSADQVREVCDVVLVMNKGKLGFFGGVEEGLEYYHKNMAPTLNPSI